MRLLLIFTLSLLFSQAQAFDILEKHEIDMVWDTPFKNSTIGKEADRIKKEAEAVHKKHTACGSDESCASTIELELLRLRVAETATIKAFGSAVEDAELKKILTHKPWDKAMSSSYKGQNLRTYFSAYFLNRRQSRESMKNCRDEMCRKTIGKSFDQMNVDYKEAVKFLEKAIK